MNNNFITKTDLAKRWSQTLINKFFPQCSKEMPNPHVRYGSPMQLYDVNDVKLIESTEAFKAEYKKVIKRKMAAYNDAKRKHDELIMYANGVQINIPTYTKEELIKKSCEHYNDWNCWKEYEYGNYDRATPSSDISFLKRITINYLRHECTCYDDELVKFFKKVGKKDAHDVLQQRINDAIKQKYEWLR